MSRHARTKSRTTASRRPGCQATASSLGVAPATGRNTIPGRGLAPSAAALIVARFVQGLGAALLLPASMLLVRGAYPDAGPRARAIAIWTAAGGSAVAAGPVVGGLLIDALGRRSIFEINVAVGAVCLLATLTCVRPGQRVPRRLDVGGQVAAAASFGGLTFALIEGPGTGWTPLPVLGAVAATVLGAAAFVAVESRVSEPMFPLVLAHRPVFVGASIVGFGLNCAFYGQVFVLSLFFQQVLGQSALVAGLSFLPMTALITVANLSAPRFAARVGALPTVSGGALLFAAGLVAALLIGRGSPAWAIAVPLVPIGVGAGLSIPPLTSQLVDSVPAALTEIAAAVALACAVVPAVLMRQRNPR